MSVRRSSFLCIVLGIVVSSSGPSAQGPVAKFHAIGDLPGGAAYTIIKDATRVGGAIYAVGGAVARASTCPAATCVLPPRVDTPILWQFDGTNATLAPLPDNVANNNSVRGAANDITPDGRYIASQAADTRNWSVRVDSTLLPSPTANLNIQTAVSPQVTDPMFPAESVSNDGSIVYAATVATTANGSISRAIRFDLSAGTSTLIPTLPTHTQTTVVSGGTSADGSVVVGDSFVGNVRRAYRYQHGVGTAAIPMLSNGTFNRALAVSPDGDLVLAIGDSDGNPDSRPYLYRASTGAVELLGTPNTPWRVGSRICAGTLCNTAIIAGRMTADGSVVAMNFFQVGGDSYAYFRNDHGWFHLSSALLAGGVDLAADGWSRLVIQGISADGTLVFGEGDHNGVVDGFVAEFSPGFLADFNPPFVPPADTSIVGTWIIDGEPTAPEAVAVFTPEGAFYQIEDDTFEWGTYRFDGSGMTIITKHDTNGSAGISDMNGSVFPLQVVGDELFIDGQLESVRVVGSQGSILGGWIGGNPTEEDNAFVIVAAPGNRYFTVQDFAEGEAGESGDYVWNPITHELTVTPFGGVADSGNVVTPSADGLSLHVVDDGGEEFDFSRVVHPSTIPVITSTLVADGAVGHTFSHPVVATNTQTFSALDLPAGLSIDPGTGVISGVPETGGDFTATLMATNSNGISDIESLALTIVVPTATEIGQNVVVEPAVPEGQAPVTLSFAEVTGDGTTAVTVIEPDELETPPPGNFSVVGVIYDVSTTATFEGLITLCFSYAELDIGGAAPRLLHYENNQWVDITTSIDTNTESVCGATTSLSPFALVVSPVVRKGFYAPVHPTAGFLNVVKGGSTVPLKFEVEVNGIEKTTTDGLELTMHPIPCDSEAPEDPVEQFPYTGGTALRYETAGHFIANWTVPKTPGLCYMVRMTTTQDDLALTARFKVK